MSSAGCLDLSTAQRLTLLRAVNPEHSLHDYRLRPPLAHCFRSTIQCTRDPGPRQRLAHHGTSSYLGRPGRSATLLACVGRLGGAATGAIRKLRQQWLIRVPPRSPLACNTVPIRRRQRACRRTLSTCREADLKDDAINAAAARLARLSRDCWVTRNDRPSASSCPAVSGQPPLLTTVRVRCA